MTIIKKKIDWNKINIHFWCVDENTFEDTGRKYYEVSFAERFHSEEDADLFISELLDKIKGVENQS
jgi:hypothetical protein